MSGFAFDVAAAFLGSFAALLVTAAVLIRLAPKLMRSAMRPAVKPTTPQRPASPSGFQWPQPPQRPASPSGFQWPQPPTVSGVDPAGTTVSNVTGTGLNG